MTDPKSSDFYIFLFSTFFYHRVLVESSPNPACKTSHQNPFYFHKLLAFSAVSFEDFFTNQFNGEAAAFSSPGIEKITLG